MKIESNMPWGKLKIAVGLSDSDEQTKTAQLFSALKKPEPPHPPYEPKTNGSASHAEPKDDSKPTADASASS
jgi:hypothetical protein